MGEDPLTDFDNTDGSILNSEHPAFPEIISCLSSSPSSSFSSVACWDVLKSEAEEDHMVNNTNVDCMDVMNTSECMDLIEGGSDMWGDHDAIFSDYQNPYDFQHNNQQITSEQQQKSTGESQGEISKDLALVFLEWLKSNKESISAEDLRKIKLKRSTIESAIQRFGGGKEGMEKLLKLILEWVQNHQLQQKRTRTPDEPCHLKTAPNPRYHPNFNDPNGNNLIVHTPPDQNPCFSISNWSVHHLKIPQPPELSPYGGDLAAKAMVTGVSSMVGYSSESMIDFNHPYQHRSDYSWSASQYSMPSPTKQARRTRMARQKRVLPHHKLSQSNHGHHQQIDKHNQLENYQQATLINTTRENCVNSAAIAGHDDLANLV